MFYQSDYKISQFLPARYKRRSLGELRKKLNKKKIETEVNFTDTTMNSGVSENFISKYFLSFCENTTVHGIKYIGQDLHWFERLNIFTLNLSLSQ